MGTSIYRVPISCDCDLLRCSMHFAGSPTSNLFAIDVYSLVDPTLTQADTYTNHQIEKKILNKEKEEKVQGETKTEPIKFTFGTTNNSTAASTQPFTFTFGTTPPTTTPSTTTPSTSSTTTSTPSTSSTPPVNELVNFIAAESFQGAKPGYQFQLGNSGLGYYLTAIKLTSSFTGVEE